MGVTAFANNNLLYSQFSGNCNLFEYYSGELNIVIPESVVRSFISGQFAG